MNGKLKPTTNDIFEAMNIYLAEWIHRDIHMWSQIYKFFFASLAIMFLPNLTTKLGFIIPSVFNNYYIFPVIGMFLALCFFYVSIGQAKRLKAGSETYKNLIKMLPKELQRVKLSDLKEFKFVNHTMAYVMPTAMFLSLIIIGIFLICSQ